MKRLRRVEPVLRRALSGDCALPAGSRILVAVSGGADSLALLLGLQRVAHEFGLELTAAHLHHGLRGSDADGDLRFVRAMCRRLGVPCEAARWDARRRMARRGLTGQAGLRTLRREFLQDAAEHAGAVAIATAHTADDQLETLLLRIGRGSGLTGLAGIRPRQGLFIRPLLEATRADVEADLRNAGQEWREDGSNASPHYTRNRIRHIAIPGLVAALHPGRDQARARDGLARQAAQAARALREAGAALDRHWTRPLLLSAGRIQGQESTLDSRGVAPYPAAAQRMVLRRFWRRLSKSGTGLTHRHLDALCRLMAGGRRGGEVRLPDGWVAAREGHLLRFRRPEGRPNTGSPE